MLDSLNLQEPSPPLPPSEASRIRELWAAKNRWAQNWALRQGQAHAPSTARHCNLPCCAFYFTSHLSCCTWIFLRAYPAVPNFFFRTPAELLSYPAFRLGTTDPAAPLIFLSTADVHEKKIRATAG